LAYPLPDSERVLARIGLEATCAVLNLAKAILEWEDRLTTIEETLPIPAHPRDTPKDSFASAAAHSAGANEARRAFPVVVILLIQNRPTLIDKHIELTQLNIDFRPIQEYKS